MNHRPVRAPRRGPFPWILVFLFLVPSLPASALGQGSPPTPEIFRDLTWRNVGPSNMMGRIAAVDALDRDWRTLLVGTASGGVWKSTNGGAELRPIFDGYGSQSIGAAVFSPADPEVIWVGTGEATNRNSVGWGDGVYRSEDGGESFERVGLARSYQIAEIAPHPSDPGEAWVAALGNLWSFDGVRGLFVTRDGGASWEKLTNGLPDDGETGASDVAVHPEDPDVLYAGMYRRVRRPWGMESGGPNGGVYKSTDGGRSWRKLGGGLPEGPTGMVDVDLYRKNPDVVVVYVGASETEGPRDLSTPGPGIYRSEDGGETWEYQLRHTSRPYYHGKVRIDPNDSSRVYVVSRHFMWTDDGGETWREGKPFGSGGGDDHDLWISPRNSEIIYSATDQGAHLALGDTAHLSFTNMAIGQYYEIGLDGRDPYWIYGGLQDNGGWAIPNRTRNRHGIRMDHAVKVNGGDGFHMAAGPSAGPGDPPTVYTTAHVGYFGRVDMGTRERTLITPTPRTTANFREVYDPDYPETQTEYTINPGEYWLWPSPPDRSVNGSILPPQFRWNWNSPLALSPHDPRTVYVGSNHLFRSADRGESWRIVSPDLTRNVPSTRNSSRSGGLVRDATGAENHHTIYTIGESPVDPAVVWVGTDDGNVQVTRDGGETWTEVAPDGPGMPDGLWVSHVEPSHHGAGTAYAAFDGHRSGDTRPHVFRTDDYGETWERITDGIPAEHPGNSVHVVIEDPEAPNLLFAGTEFGCFVSLDRGESWRPLMSGLPPVAVRDLEIHPREGDLVAGTHGRSLWVLDDLRPLRQLTRAVRERPLHVFEGGVVTKWLDRTNYRLRTSLKFQGDNPPPGARVDFWLAEDPEGDSVTVAVSDPHGGGASGEAGAATAAGGAGVGEAGAPRTRRMTVAAGRGINRAYWDLRFPPEEAEREAYRERLREAAGTIRERLESGEVEGAPLDLMADDVLEPQRYPEAHEDVDYPAESPATDGPERRGGEDDRRVLLAHLDGVAAALDSASGWRDLNEVRDQLLSFSPVVGDTAFLGFYPDPLRPAEAEPGVYRVRVEVGEHAARGTVRVRPDPLKGGGR